MKMCSDCGASNADAARFWGDCGHALAPLEPTRGPKVGAADLAATVASKIEALQARRQADVMFALDCTMSMQGEIDAIRDAIMAFADTIASDGVRARVGLIAFYDRLIGEESQVLSFDGDAFTSDPAAFRAQVSALRARGGGDEPESSLDGVMLACRQPFRADTSKVIVLVTDAPPHVPDRETRSVDEVVQAMAERGIDQCYLVIRTQDPRSQVYLKLLEGRRFGMAFELGRGDEFRARTEDFKRALMKLAKTISTATR